MAASATPRDDAGSGGHFPRRVQCAMSEAATETIVGVVLAGGRSQRMGGGDKSLRDFGGRTMLAHIVHNLAPQVGRVIVNANGDVARFQALGLPVVADAAQDFAGPLAGVLAGMRWATANIPKVRRIVTVPSDAPFMPPDLVVRLIAASDAAGGAIAVAQSAGVLHHVTALWPVSLADALASAVEEGERRVGNWAARQGIVAVPFDPVQIGGHTVDPFFNINTPDNYLEAAALMGLVGTSTRLQ
jgi:molybdopterin-guanine dinucleotide biosynthesis protein A